MQSSSVSVACVCSSPSPLSDPASVMRPCAPTEGRRSSWVYYRGEDAASRDQGMEQIKRVNKLFSNDCIFLRNTLNIPVKSEKRSLFNGLSLESPDGEGSMLQEPPCTSQDMDVPSPQPEPAAPEPNTRPVQTEELSAKDYLHRLDLQIKQSKQAARKLKEDGGREEDDSTNSNSSYQEI
ncbi:lysM and putative peptidoglycan-binding domain-containing protein 2-like isoform X2 [Myxocyprinus asiaticus]|uniref:lysM and putative peptidoglycan-binding domain-containing protein 2-like isoform X2 n=1 Tax=Myxocyprinus asiaticus TaxID=70543 RepID=UPI002222AFB4|nr:lysM and putative peptidoglycan-binding domain-containing protein 2-like isoform X2 [Myxocyprinus asiaticus]